MGHPPGRSKMLHHESYVAHCVPLRAGMARLPHGPQRVAAEVKPNGMSGRVREVDGGADLLFY